MEKSHIKHQRKILDKIILDYDNGVLDYNNNRVYKTLIGLIIQYESGQTYDEIIKQLKSSTKPQFYFSDPHGWKSSYLNFENQVKKFWLPLQNTTSPMLDILSNMGITRDLTINLDKFNGKEILKYITETQTKDIFENKVEIKYVEQFTTLHYDKIVPRKDWWGRLWGFKETIVKDVRTPNGYKEEEVTTRFKSGTKQVPIKLNPDKDAHMIIYVKAYLSYLDVLEKANKDDEVKQRMENPAEQQQVPTIVSPVGDGDNIQTIKAVR